MTRLSDVRLFPAPAKSIWPALAVNFVWINLSEVFRYFIFVMPMMREALPGVPGVAPMNLGVFMIWGVWDTILVFCVTLLSWLFLERFGNSVRVAVAAGTFCWLAIFVILWLGLYNMNLTTAKIAATALPLAWLEMVIAAMVVRWRMLRS